MKALGAPLTNIANWFSSSPVTEKLILYMPALTTVMAAVPAVWVNPADISPLVSRIISSS